MQIFCYIMTLYILVLSVSPCSDVHPKQAGSRVIATTVYMQPNECEHHGHGCLAHCCSPFCVCSCCHTVVNIPKLASVFVHTKGQFLPKKQKIVGKNKTLVSHYFARILRPPIF